MKKLIPIYLLLLLVSTTTKAQPYKSIFGDSTSTWTCYYRGLATYFIGSVASGDTLINGRYHKRVAHKFNGIPYDIVFEQIALLREDTITGKVWYRSLPRMNQTRPYQKASRDTVERLLMDLTLQLGDTFRLGNIVGINDTIAIVDSIYFDADNRKHIRFNRTTSGNIKFEFIESVGTTLGMAYTDSNVIQRFVTHNNGLICAFHDTANIYSTALKAQLFNECIPTSSISQLSKHKQLPIYPNPSTGEFRVDIPTKKQTQVTITNINGQVVYHKEVVNKTKHTIDLATQPKGIYTIQLVDEQNSYINKLLLE